MELTWRVKEQRRSWRRDTRLKRLLNEFSQEDAGPIWSLFNTFVFASYHSCTSSDLLVEAGVTNLYSSMKL